MEGIEEEVRAAALPTTDGSGHDDGPSTPRADGVTATSASPPADAAPPSPEHHAKKESGHSVNNRAKDSACQDSDMLATLEYLEQEVGFTRMDNLSLQKEIEWLQSQNLDLKNRLRVVASEFKQRGCSAGEKDDQTKLLMNQKDELLHLLEVEQRAKLRQAQTAGAAIQELDTLKLKHEALQATMRTQEKIVSSVSKESLFWNDEISLLRQELGNLRARHAELQMKMELDVEALEKQLRDRKETQYKLVEGKRRADEQVEALEAKSKAIFEKYGKLGAHLQHETQVKRSQEEGVAELAGAVEGLRLENKALKDRLDIHEQESLGVEESSRKNKDQLHDMAQMVFQLLSSLKLSESRKLEAAESMRIKNQELSVAKMAYSASARKEKARIKAESERKTRRERARALQKHNLHVSQRSKIESDDKLQGGEGGLKQLEETLNILGARLTFLLEKGQDDERQQASPKEDTRDMEVEVTNIRFRPSSPGSHGAFLSSMRGVGEGANLAETSQFVLARQSSADSRGQRLGWTGRVGGMESPHRISKK